MDWHGARSNAVRELSDDERRALASGRDEAISQFVRLGWLELERDYAFQRSYRVIGVYER